VGKQGSAKVWRVGHGAVSTRSGAILAQFMKYAPEAIGFMATVQSMKTGLSP